MTFSRFTSLIVQGVQAYEGPQLYTQQDIDLFNSELDIRLWGHRIRFTGTLHQVGDPVVSSASFWDLFRGLAAVLDDYVFRPVVHLSPLALGAVIGWFASFSLLQWFGIGILAKWGPGYLGDLGQGIVLGALGSEIWGFDWSLAKDAARSLGGNMFEGGTGIQDWLFP